MIIEDEDDFIIHIGTPRHSGRYPWGSGKTPHQRHRNFLDTIESLKKQGLTDKEIYTSMKINSTDYRNMKSIAKNAEKAELYAKVMQMKHDRGMSTMAIGKALGKNESSIRSIIDAGERERVDIVQTTANRIKDRVDKDGFIDIGGGVENQIGLSQTRLMTAAAHLEDMGYALHKVQFPQQGTNNLTTTKVMAPPGTTYQDIKKNLHLIRPMVDHTEDGGRSWAGLLPPVNIPLKRVDVKYKEDGGEEADGVIYVRRGVEDVSLGGNNYAQVRIAVNGSHYLKGMAMYKDDLPDGVDLQFNTNKSKTDPKIVAGGKLEAMKPLKVKKDTGEVDQENPFGAVVRQIGEKDDRGNITKVTSAMNIVNEEGRWDDWSRNLATQMLSKQSPALAKQQLDLTLERNRNEFEKISKLTNPTIRRKLLENFAEEADSAAVHLKAAALPRQRTQVILPMNSLKPNEVYAPNFNPGERVALVRFPHGGKFEIPELVVNNSNRKAKELMGQATDAIGIHHEVAKKLSGADFDGDTVLVIPNNSGRVASQPALRELKGFDPQRDYKGYEGMTKMTAAQKGREMGDVSNLITDMTIKGAPDHEIARAVKHSMVVIDAEKHGLNWKQSALDNNIRQLKEKYQGKTDAGASTIISRAKSTANVPERKRNFKIDPETGEKVWTYTGRTYETTTVSKRTGEVKVKVNDVTTKSTKLAEAKDARTLSSGTRMEEIYATHSNKLKALANTARKEAVNTQSIPYNPSAAKVYKGEVDSLNAKLNTALSNRPRERQAQLLAGAHVKAVKDAYPDMEDDELKKVKGQALTEARIRTGADKDLVYITDNEWQAIQAGAISNNKLSDILTHGNIERVKELATPRSQLTMNASTTARAKQMLADGYTQSEVAAHLGIGLTTLKEGVK